MRIKTLNLIVLATTTVSLAACASSTTGPMETPIPAPVSVVPEQPATTLVASAPVPAGGLTLEELRNATITVPPWNATGYDASGCATGAQTVNKVQAENAAFLKTALSYVDIDGDGTFETIGTLICQQGEVGPQQGIIVGRDGKGVKTIGQVMSTRDGVKQIGELTGMSDGTIQVSVRDRALCCDTPPAWAQEQIRTYGWDGKRFGQVSGSTAFHPADTATDLQLVKPKAVFGKPVDGVRTANVKVTIRNNGSVAAERVVLSLRLNGALGIDAQWDSHHGELYGKPLNQLAPGAETTVEFTLTTKVTRPGEVGVYLLARAAKANGDFVADGKPNDNDSSHAYDGVDVVEFR